MADHQVQALTGLEALEALTTLLQGIRVAHPTAGLLEAADLQWWWRRPRPSDAQPQLIWFAGDGRPIAAGHLTDWGDRTSLEPILPPDAAPDLVAEVLDRSLAAAADAGVDAIGIEADPADATLRAALLERGSTPGDAWLEEGWLDAALRPPVSPLAAGYRLADRRATTDRPHHLVERNGPDVERRLRETSLYRDALDLVVLAPDGSVAAYALCWHDPVSATGLVEPMRTEDAHQRRGLARHLLTAGIERLAEAGARRIKICWELDNAASGPLYRSVGFVPFRRPIPHEGRTRPDRA